jgi:uncharacterized protein (TIGR02270 family)
MLTQPFRDLQDESLDEAQFLWRRWRQELQSPTRNLREIYSWTEDRLQGTLDGVRIGSPSEVEAMLGPALLGEDATTATIAAHILAVAPTKNGRAPLCDAVRQVTGPKLDALIDGFAVAELDGSFAPVVGVLSKTSPEHLAALCTLKAFRRATLGQELVDTYESKVPALQARALQAAAFLSSERVNAWIKAGLEHTDKNVRTAATVTGIRRRNTHAWNAATQLVRMSHADAGALLNYVAMFGSASEHQAILVAVDHPELNKAATSALSVVGTREAIERCLHAMRNEALARLAGEAYCSITGAELERDKLAAKDPADDAPPPSFEADDLNANLVPTAEALWPLPNIDAVQRHWSSIQSGFKPGVRYVRGQPCDVSALIAMIETAPMLHRPEWIFEVAVRTQGQYDVEPLAFVRQQQAMMQTSRARVAS